LLHFRNSFGDLDTSGARFGAVESGATAPHTLFIVQDVQPDLSAFIPGIKNEAVGVDDSGRAKILTIGPEDGAARGAGSTEDALGGVIKAGTLFG
jgi:hypothetical protein